MGLLRPCGLLIVLLALSLIACGESKRGQVTIEPADKDTGEKTDKEKDRDKDKDKDKKKDKEKGKFTDLASIHAEVTALEVLHALDVNDEQLKHIGELAGKTAQDAPARREIRAEEKYRTALLEFRAALRTGDD